jgi:hypothetical protein
VATGIALAPGAGAKGRRRDPNRCLQRGGTLEAQAEPGQWANRGRVPGRHEQDRQGLARPDPAQRRADLRGKASHEGAERGVHRASSDEQPGGDGFVPRRSESGRVGPDLRGACVDRLTASARPLVFSRDDVHRREGRFVLWSLRGTGACGGPRFRDVLGRARRTRDLCVSYLHRVGAHTYREIPAVPQ